MQASAKAMRLRAQGIATDAAFLEEEGAATMDEAEREAAELAAADRQFQAQLKKEVGVICQKPFLCFAQAFQAEISDLLSIVSTVSLGHPKIVFLALHAPMMDNPLVSASCWHHVLKEAKRAPVYPKVFASFTQKTPVCR